MKAGFIDSPVEKHRAMALRRVKFIVLVTSSTIYERMVRGLELKDEAGELIGRILEAEGHEVLKKLIAPNDKNKILKKINEALKLKPDVIIITGGTGLSSRDVTIEAVEHVLEKRVPGFGELFRKISFEEIGTAAMLTRATAGVYKGVMVFSLPGSPHAVEVALKKLILPEIGHAVMHLREV